MKTLSPNQKVNHSPVHAVIGDWIKNPDAENTDDEAIYLMVIDTAQDDKFKTLLCSESGTFSPDDTRHHIDLPIVYLKS